MVVTVLHPAYRCHSMHPIYFVVLLLTINVGLAKTIEWCPPKHLSKRTPSKVKTAIISEIHGQISPTGMDRGRYRSGQLLSRHLYFHIAIMGFDVMYLNVMYNESVHLTPPTVEDIYPGNASCVKTWFDRGMLRWRPVVYGGKDQSKWLKDDKNLPTLERKFYQTIRGINPAYSG